jgi:translocator protein
VGLGALVDIGVLWILVGLTVRAFWRTSPFAGWLMVPPWFWVSFAGVFNAAVWKAYPELLG